jgi:hypothetical protein
MKEQEYYMKTEYHLRITERLLQGYKETNNTLYLTNSIKELAKATLNLITAYLTETKNITTNHEKNIKRFNNKAPITNKEKEHTKKILEASKTLKQSPISYNKQGNIILLINGGYKILKKERIEEFKNTITHIKQQLHNIRQV